MKDKGFLKILVFLMILLLVINMVMLALKSINAIVFWSVIIVVAVFAYKVLPKLR